MRENVSRWFGYGLRRNYNHIVKKKSKIIVKGNRKRDRPKKKWIRINRKVYKI